jgi:hypothetical protein
MSKRRKIFNLSQLPDGIGGGVTQFIGLTDTPNSYSGQTGKSVRVNVTETGLEYYTPSEVGSTISFLDLIDTPSSYTSNSLRLLRVNAGANAIEYDPNSYATTARIISTNNGLSGGGDLSADRTLGLTGQALALHNLATNGYIVRTGAGTVTARTITAGTGISITNGDGVAGNTTITLNAGLANLTGVSFTSLTSNQTLVYNGTNWVNQAYTTGTVTSIAAGTGLSGGTITTSGTIGFDTTWGDARYSRLIEVLDNQTVWSHVALQNGIDFTPYTTGSAGYPSTLGFAVAFYANTSDSTSGYGRAFALNRAYNTESYFIGSPNTSGVHNGWRLIYHSGNLTLSTLGGVPTTTTLTINGTSQDLSTNRTFSVGTVTSITAGTGLSGGTISGSGTIALTGQALALHNLATNGIIYRNGATIGTRTITGSTFITVTNGDGASGNPTITLGTLNLGDLSNVILTTPASGQVLSFNGTNWVNAAISGGGGGTVTSVATGTGLTGGTITTTGTISVVFGTTAGTVAEGNDSRILNGQTAFGWGNHASAGYLLSSTASTTYVPLTRTITINGTALDLSANRSWSVGTVISVATGTGLTGGAITSSGTISLTGQALALHNLATNGLIARTGAGTVTARTITAGTGISVSNGDGVAGNPTIASTITQYTDALARTAISLTTTGSSGASTYSSSTGVLNVPNYTLTGLGGQPLSTNLTSLAGLTFVSSSFVRMTATGTFTLDTNTYYLASNPNGYTTNTGTVTSVGLSLPAIFSVTGSPVTGSGTLTATLASQSANTVFSAPNGSAGAPTFRALVAADIPNLDTSKLTSGTLGVARGGTGIASYTVGNYIRASGTTTLEQRTPAQVLSDIGAYASSNPNGYTTNTGTVTSVSGTGSYGGLTLSGTVTTSGNITLGGTPTGTWPISISGIATGVVNTVSGTNSAELVRGNMADNDQFRILVGGTASNAGFVEIATADDGTEPIHVRQYTGVFASLTRTATLLDGSGNTSFPGTLTAASLVRSGGTSSQFLKADGSVDSNAYVPTSRTITINGTALDLSANRSWSVGTVTQVSGTGGYGGLTLSGTVNTSGNITLGGTPTGTWPISVSGFAGATASGTITNLNTAWTLPGTSISNGFYIYRYDNTATNKPVSINNANWLMNIYSHPTGGTASYGHQLAAADADNIYFRTVTNGGFGSWRTVYHSGNASLQAVTDVGNTTSNSISIGTGSSAGETFLNIGNNKTVNSPAYIDFQSRSGTIDYDFRILKNSGASGVVDIRNISGSMQLVNEGADTILLGTSNTGRLYILGNGRVLINTLTDNGQNFQVSGTGLFSSTVTASNFITSSDRRLKTNIEKIENALDKLSKISSYEYLKNGDKEAGFIAQEVEEVLPYAVYKNNEGYLTMSDRPILAYIHKAILELKEEIDNLKNNK